jgi:hypothetical protein
LLLVETLDEKDDAFSTPPPLTVPRDALAPRPVLNKRSKPLVVPLTADVN